MARSLVTTALELSEISYRPDKHAADDAEMLGFNRVKHYGNGGPHAMVAEDENCRFIVYRGTELSDVSDVVANLRFIPVPSRVGGYVHRGFQATSDSLWTDMSSEFSDNKPLVFCGHSLGGALALISASQTGICRATRGQSLPLVVTAGCPLVGSYLWRRAAVQWTQKIVRVSNNNDPICRIPLWPIYGHPISQSLHFTADGRVVQNPGLRDRLTDTSVGCCAFVSHFLKSVWRNRSFILAFAEALGERDHAVHMYAAMARKNREEIDEKVAW